MCHVACCPQSRLFDPISGRFTPIRAANPRSDAEVATHSLIPPETWRLEPGCRVVLWLSPNGAAVHSQWA